MHSFALRLATSAFALCLVGIANDAFAECSYAPNAGEAEKTRLVNLYNQYNNAERVAEKCALLPRIIALNEQNKAQFLAVLDSRKCTSTAENRATYLRNSAQDLQSFREALRDECKNAGVVAERKKTNFKHCNGVVYPTEYTGNDEQCIVIHNGCGAPIKVFLINSRSKDREERDVPSNLATFCSLSIKWKYRLQDYTIK